MAVDRIGDGLALRSKGDIISHNGTENYVLNAGSDGKILTAQSSTESGLFWETNAYDPNAVEDWAPIGYAKITSSAMTGAASMSVSSIPSSYSDLVVYIVASGTTEALSPALLIRFNGETSSANSAYVKRTAQYRDNNGATRDLFGESGPDLNLGNLTSYYGQVISRNLQSFAKLYIPNYASTTYKKVIRGTFGNARDLLNDGLGHSGRRVEFSGIWMSTSAINQITVTTSASKLDYLSSIHVYGLKR